MRESWDPLISTARPTAPVTPVLIFPAALFVDTIDDTMDTENLLPLLEQLDDNVDDLEDALQPLLGSSLNKMSKNMPIMDRAKIHVLTTYALESLIFCKPVS
jgi:hypothetical protein